MITSEAQAVNSKASSKLSEAGDLWQFVHRPNSQQQFASLEASAVIDLRSETAAGRQRIDNAGGAKLNAKGAERLLDRPSINPALRPAGPPPAMITSSMTEHK